MDEPVRLPDEHAHIVEQVDDSAVVELDKLLGFRKLLLDLLIFGAAQVMAEPLDRVLHLHGLLLQHHHVAIPEHVEEYRHQEEVHKDPVDDANQRDNVLKPLLVERP